MPDGINDARLHSSVDGVMMNGQRWCILEQLRSLLHQSAVPNMMFVFCRGRGAGGPHGGYGGGKWCSKWKVDYLI